MNEAESHPNMENKCPQCGAPLPSGVLAGLCPACLFKQGAAPDTAAKSEAAQFQPPGIQEISRLFPQLEILSLIGKGGMGAVYRARQPALDRIVALKILPPQVATGSNFVERFNREARALAKLNHPNIVAVYEFGQAGGLSYFIMEFVDGVNLRELERAGKLSPREALQIVPQICEALQFAHDEGVVHRDIKPENILLDKKGRVKIADFGIAKILGAEQVDLTGTQAAIGTPHYMAPEQMEKPTAVDHRADIFSLGVVFYEMLTGELPLGKFAPPSTRKVEVDVRLDDVVLRALEKDPELRYQHASQVKTAVDTISGSAAPPPKSPGVDAQALAQDILEQDYTLNIRSCFRRARTLLKTEFWPFVGITALILALFSFASFLGGTTGSHHHEGGGAVIVSGTAGMLVVGPLIGGLYYYFLKKVRREKVTVEAAFCGFTKERFLHLFLAGFATSLMTWVGFFCLVLPGIYLWVAWMFTLPLVVDKQLDFWSAMELSRKVVTQHWFKFFGMTLLMVLLMFAGVILLWVGILVAMPLIFLTVMYAYEDIFGSTAPAAKQAATGPSGTIAMAPARAAAANPSASKWSTPTKLGVAGVGLLILIIVLVPLLRDLRIRHRGFEIPAADASAVPSPPINPPEVTGTPVEAAEPPAADVFGPVTELELTNLSAINVATAGVQSLPATVAEMNRGPERDSAVSDWLESTNMDFAFISAYDGFYSMTRDFTPLKRDDWDTATPQSIGSSLRDTTNDVAARFGDSGRLNNPTNFTYGFKTRGGLIGLLQISAYTDNPSGVKLRYKFFQPTNQDLTTTNASNDISATNTTSATHNTRDVLASRLEAAINIENPTGRDQALARIAIDAGKAGEADLAWQTVNQMQNVTARDSTIHQAALLLSKHGLPKPALDMARQINNVSERDQTLSELAQ
jgi:predicted Ser/Thr protein kinase